MCCSNLISKYENLVFGLYLSPKEVKYFPKKSVHPLFKTGTKIIAYQVAENICPNLVFDGKESSCKIYNHRPLGCKAFPLKYTHEIDSNLCIFVKEHLGSEWNYESFDEQHKAIEQQNEEANSTKKATQMYLFESHKWINYDGH